MARSTSHGRHDLESNHHCRRKVKVSLTEEELQLAAQCCQVTAKPRRWRKSEYDMTKAAATGALDEIAKSGEVTGLNLSLLLGELARAYQESGRAWQGDWECLAEREAYVAGRLDILNLFSRLRAALCAELDMAKFAELRAAKTRGGRKAVRVIKAGPKS